MENLLSSLKKSNKYCTSVSLGYKKDIYFLIRFNQVGAFVTIVDNQNKSIEVDYRHYSGNLFSVLRSIDNIKQDLLMQITWDQTEPMVYLSDNPYLLYQLMRCNNLIDETGATIISSSASALVKLILTKEGNTITSSFALSIENSDSSHFKLLSDSFALADGVIYNIEPLGENYNQLSLFISSFSEDMLEKFLSLFFSYIESVKVIYENYSVEYSEAEIVTTPAILFQKISEDKALYLSLVECAQGLDIDFLQEFDLTYVASMGMEQKIVLKRIVHSPMDSHINKLKKQLLQHAPNRQAQKEIYQDNNFFIIPQETAAPFLLESLPLLLKEYQLIGTNKLHEYKIKAVKPKLNISITSDIDFLEGDASIQLDEDSFTIKQIIAQYQKQKYIILSDGNRAILEDSYIRKLERIFNRSKIRNRDKIAISFFDLPEIEEMLNGPITGEAFTHHRKIYEGFNELTSQKIKLPHIKADLREYQKEGVKWIKYLHDNNLGGCLADDMGLGKTIQTIAMLTQIYPKVKQPTLIVMPPSLLFNWNNELARFAPQLTVYTYHTPERNIDEAMNCQLILTTYSILRNDVERLNECKFYYVILDESQNIKNIAAQTTQASFLLKSKHRLALSGTPIENNLTELYSLFRFLNPTMFGSLDEFNARYTYPIQKDNDKDVMLSLRKKIFPFMLRRLKKDVLKELPDRTEQTLYVEMGDKQAQLYEQRRSFYYSQIKSNIASEGIGKAQFVMFQALNELRRIASVPESMSDGEIVSPKLEVLMESLIEAVSNNHKVVVFCNYLASIELVSDQLNANGVDFACMTGSTHDRRSVIERFQNDSSCMVLLMTLKTGGVGLNLTVADTVYIFEPWWNKAAEEQAINRLHRYGQTANVLSFSLITRNSIEEKICLLQQKKAELFSALIGNDSSSSKQLSEEDINFILG